MKTRRTNRHHRKSRSRTGGNSYDGEYHGIPNVIVVNQKKHLAFHLLFQDTHPVQIAKELTETWVDPNYVILAIEREDAKKVLKLLSQLVK